MCQSFSAQVCSTYRMTASWSTIGVSVTVRKPSRSQASYGTLSFAILSASFSRFGIKLWLYTMYCGTGARSSSTLSDMNGITKATEVRSTFADISKPTYTSLPFVLIGSSFTWQAFHLAISM